jgi:hypothetical protein
MRLFRLYEIPRDALGRKMDKWNKKSSAKVQKKFNEKLQREQSNVVSKVFESNPNAPSRIIITNIARESLLNKETESQNNFSNTVSALRELRRRDHEGKLVLKDSLSVEAVSKLMMDTRPVVQVEAIRTAMEFGMKLPKQTNAQLKQIMEIQLRDKNMQDFVRVRAMELALRRKMEINKDELERISEETNDSGAKEISTKLRGFLGI